MTVTGALQDGSGRVVGVTAKSGRGKNATTFEVRASITVDAGGVAARLATSLGLEKKMNRPMGVAARAYFHSPRGDEEWMESHLELWSGTPGASDLLPGYGWIFPMGDGIVNVGLGSVASRAGATNLPYREVFKAWTANLPEEWGFTPENQIGQLRSAALPMSFNRKPHYVQGLVLVGDAGGMVSPYNGEGIAPGHEGRTLRCLVHRAGPVPLPPRRHRPRHERIPPHAPRRIRRLLPARPHLRRAHRKPDDHAHLHERRAAHSAPHDARPQTPVGRVREERGRLRRPTHHHADQGGATRMTTTIDNREER